MTHITPPELHGLLAIAREEGLDMKPVLLRVLTDLYVSTPAHTSDEAAQFREIAGTLVQQVDGDTALVVACKLAGYAQTPVEVGAAFLARGDDSARILLADARWLPAGVLIEQAAVGDRVMAAAVAARAEIGPDMVRLLLGREDPLIDVTLAANTSVALPADVMDLLLDRARDEDAIAKALLSRGDLNGAERAVLYLAADKAERLKIIEEVERLVALSGRARSQRIASQELVVPMETAAMYGDAESFATVLALGLGASVAKSQKILADRSGEALALALLSLGFSDEVATRIFMFRDPLIGQSSERVHALVDLFRRVSPPAAERLVSAMLGAGPARPRTGSHVPQTDQAEAPHRSAAALAASTTQAGRRAG
ncbi:DUF2336 domain-containing protein [Alsobacter sp. KACC 23698]|uniref:DUF2336 domain-containing protein n=1 Tax=Alsobacter sp. KACC 23698 TaxID=3149229 RepID=A0AAU7JIH0_9HYPH